MIKAKLRCCLMAATTTASLFFYSNHTLAIEDIVKIKGIYEFQTIYYKNDGKPEQRVVSHHNKEFGFGSVAHIFLDYGLIAENNDLYGARISIEHTSQNDRSAPFYIYYESKFGRIEGGSDGSAGRKMRLTAYSASCSPGNGWNAIIQPSPNNPIKIKNRPVEKLIAYITNFCGFLDSKTRTTAKTDYSRKLTYFTPKLKISDTQHLQFGISYIPDSSNMGHDKINTDNKNSPVGIIPYKFVIKDGISYGVVYSNKLSNQISTKISFVGEVGRPIAYNKYDNKKSDIKFKDLNAYVLGGELKYNNIHFSASYTNYNKSLTSEIVDKISRTSYAYGFGVKYNLQKYAFSLNQFNSNHKKSTLSATSLGAEYKITQGVKTYTQTTFYTANGKYLLDDAIKNYKSKGILIYLGAQVSF